MKNNKKNNIKSFHTNKDIHILIIISIVTIFIATVLWLIGFRNESIITLIIGLSIWAIRTLLVRYFKTLDDKVDEQKQILLQGTQTGFGFKQKIMVDMYDVTCQLWEKSIWIATNWKALWPRYDTQTEIRSNFKKKFDDYIEFLKIKSIIIPSKIYKSASGLVDGINTYELGRMERDDTLAPQEIIKHGSGEMSSGAKLVQSSMNDLFKIIRKEFDLDSLPGEVLNIDKPEDITD